MSQHDLTIDNQGFPAFRADLNNALQALGSTQSGTSAPSPTFANQLWYDTTNNQLKIRNEDNDAWIVLATLDQTGDVTSAVGAKTLPAGDIVGTSDSQTLTNKTINASQLVDASVTPAKLSTQAQYTGYKNRIINGAMVIDQRNAGASVTPTINPQYLVDRWAAENITTNKLSYQQNAGSVTPPAGFTNYLGITSLSAYSVSSTDYFLLQQRIEGFNVADLDWGTANAKTVTLSFWVRSSLTGTFGGNFQNEADNRFYAFSYSISSANTWEYKTITLAGDTTGTWAKTNGTGIMLRFNLGAGSTYIGTAGAWGSSTLVGVTGQVNLVGTNGATFYITGVQLEVGSTATSFDYRPYGTELMLCQRYFEKSYNIDVAPATATDTGRFDFAGTSDGNGNVITKIVFKVTKRSNPTMTGYVGGGTSGSWTYERSGANGTNSVTFDVIGQSSSRVYLPIGVNWSAGYIYGQWTASSEL